MAQVTVFVDDVVAGRLPSLCVKEGVPTEDRLTVHHAVGETGLGFAWLLLLLGPVGWVCLVIIALSRPAAPTVSGRLPFSEFAYRRLLVARRMERIWFGAAAVTGVLAFVVLVLSSGDHATTAIAIALGAAALGSLVKAGLESRRARHTLVRLELDGSRRWVTIYGVHPDFANAVVAAQAEQAALSARQIADARAGVVPDALL
jgi:hypothetical protein